MVTIGAAANRIKIIFHWKQREILAVETHGVCIDCIFESKMPSFLFISNAKSSRRTRVLFLCTLHCSLCTLTSIVHTTLVSTLSNGIWYIYTQYTLYICPQCVYERACVRVRVYVHVDNLYTYYTVETGDTVERSHWCVVRPNACTQNGLCIYISIYIRHT